MRICILNKPLECDSQFKVYKVTIGRPSIWTVECAYAQLTLCFVRPWLVTLFVTRGISTATLWTTSQFTQLVHKIRHFYSHTSMKEKKFWNCPRPVLIFCSLFCMRSPTNTEKFFQEWVLVDVDSLQETLSTFRDYPEASNHRSKLWLAAARVLVW